MAGRFRILIGSLLVFIAVVPAAARAQGAPGAVWHLSQSSQATNFVPGSNSPENGSALASPPMYYALLTNAGGATADGESEAITIVDTLPAGVTFGAQEPQVRLTNEGKDQHACKRSSNGVVPQTVTCTVEIAIKPGESIEVAIPVAVGTEEGASLLNRIEVSGGGASPTSSSLTSTISGALPQFEFLPAPQGLEGVAFDESGLQSTSAGSHPYSVTLEAHITTKEVAGLVQPAEAPRQLVFELPQGMVANPQAPTIHCTESRLVKRNEGPGFGCPPASQVGTVNILSPPLGTVAARLYAMESPPGVPAEFGFNLQGVNIHVKGGVNSDRLLTATTPDIVNRIPILGIEAVLWGNPGDPRHDAQREGLGCPEGCALTADEANKVPFLTMPTSCGEQSMLSSGFESWQGTNTSASTSFFEAEEGPREINGCNALEFQPTIKSQATTNLADSPSGLDFNLHLPQPPQAAAGEGTIEFCEPGTWTGNPSSYAYQWLRNGVPIPGAEAHTYEVASEDIGTALQCEVAASSNAAEPGRAASSPIFVRPLAAKTPPSVSKQPTIGLQEGSSNVFVCDPGSWRGEPGFTYQWFKNGAPVPGQTANTDEVPGGEPSTLQCEVLGTVEGVTAVAFSAASGSSLPGSKIPPGTFMSAGQVPLATATLKDTTVTLPAGMTLNPSAGNGLDSCSESQIGYAPVAGKIRFDIAPQTCPNASKLGTLEVSTPLLDHKLPGAVYLAKPYDNPFGSLTAIYLAIEDEESGLIAKLGGKVTPDPSTGQLSATFTESPELPLEDIDLHFFNGTRAALTTPLTCGTKTTTSTLTPWSTPEGQDAHPSDSFQTQVAAGGSGTCPSSEADAPNSPAFTAGTIAPQAGAYSPFVLRLARKDGTQRLTGIDTLLPKGLAAKFAGIPYCSEAQIAQAQSRSNPNQGALEKASPSCPAASEVGTVEVGAGSGPVPLYVQGHAYLAGPYKGAPLSLAIITPAIAGPFDLGAVVVRTAIYVDPETAQGRAVSDPLPSILQGIPLDIRSVAIKLDRPGGFTLNPTSCDPMAVTGSAAMLTGQSAALTSPFQVGGCSALKFKPNLKISLKGGTKRHKFPALKAVLTYPKGNNANIASAQVTLPHSAFLEQSHIGTVCTRVQFAADACPKASIYGKARAITPLLDQPLEGPVYLRSSSHELPDLVAALHGQIDVDLVGRVDTGKGGGIRNTFEAAPDAPVSRFVLEMQGGKKGLLVNSEDICRKPQRATVALTGQNGKAFDATPLIANSCKGKAKKKSAKKGGSHGKKGGKGK